MAAKARFGPPLLVPVFGNGGVPPAWLEGQLGSPTVRILDVRNDGASRERIRHRGRAGVPSTFSSGHIPGSVPLDVRGSLFDACGAFVSAPELAILMSTLGVGDEHTVVVVGDGPGGAANDAVRALSRYGHRDVHLLEGGFSRWVGEGRGVSYELVRHAPASFTARVPT